MTMDEIINDKYEMRALSDKKMPFVSDQNSVQLNSNRMTHNEAYCCEDEIIGSLSGFNWIQTSSWEGQVAIILNL